MKWYLLSVETSAGYEDIYYDSRIVAAPDVQEAKRILFDLYYYDKKNAIFNRDEQYENWEKYDLHDVTEFKIPDIEYLSIPMVLL